MELITGGKYQGKTEYALNVLGACRENIIDDLNDQVRSILLEGGDPFAWLEDILERSPDAVIIADEVGCGIIPLDAKDREYRITLGRVVCELSEKAEHVYRVVAGLGIRLK